jgi:hypothetical protein
VEAGLVAICKKSERDLAQRRSDRHHLLQLSRGQRTGPWRPRTVTHDRQPTSETPRAAMPGPPPRHLDGIAIVLRFLERAPVVEGRLVGPRISLSPTPR